LGREDPQADYSAGGTTVMRKRIARLGIAIAAMGAASGAVSESRVVILRMRDSQVVE